MPFPTPSTRRASLPSLGPVLTKCTLSPRHSAVPLEFAARRTLSGNTLVVTNIHDAGAGSLREAVATALSGDVITFDPSLSGATITNSTIRGNCASLRGGVVAADRVVLRNSTVSGNSAPLGSNLYATDEVVVEHSTIVGNSSGNSLRLEATMVARNSIFSSPIASCGLGASLFAEGTSVFSDNTCSLIGAPGIIADAKLAPLAVDGFTAVHHLMFGSPAINAAPTCLVNTDQRGLARPLGGACDLGSIEEPVPLIVTPTASAGGTINSKTGVVLINRKVTCSVDGAVSFHATVEQTQKRGTVAFVLKASTPVQTTCVNGAALWSAFTVPASGAFAIGAATVTRSVAGVGSVLPFTRRTAIRLNWAK